MYKRLFDILVAASLLLLTLPLMLATALAVRLAMGKPVLLRQTRPGRGGIPFLFYKFRTMTEDRDGSGCLLPDERRLTPFGRWLRGTSLDELPQLICILKGDMSFVGPRPALFNQDDLIVLRTAANVHTILPGLTG